MTFRSNLRWPLGGRSRQRRNLMILRNPVIMIKGIKTQNMKNNSQFRSNHAKREKLVQLELLPVVILCLHLWFLVWWPIRKCQATSCYKSLSSSPTISSTPFPNSGTFKECRQGENPPHVYGEGQADRPWSSELVGPGMGERHSPTWSNGGDIARSQLEQGWL